MMGEKTLGFLVSMPVDIGVSWDSSVEKEENQIFFKVYYSRCS